MDNRNMQNDAFKIAIVSNRQQTKLIYGEVDLKWEMSFMNIKNRSGPSIDPCGIDPFFVILSSDFLLRNRIKKSFL